MKYWLYITFRLLAGSKGTATYEVLMSDGYKKVRDSNIDLRVSFNKSRWNMAKTISTPKTAYYGIKEYVLGIEKFQCKVNIRKLLACFLNEIEKFKLPMVKNILWNLSIDIEIKKVFNNKKLHDNSQFFETLNFMLIVEN